MKRKYLAGFHSAVNIDNESIDYYVHWLEKAKEAEAKGNMLVVFELPADSPGGGTSSLIEKIERFLQDEELRSQPWTSGSRSQYGNYEK